MVLEIASWLKNNREIYLSFYITEDVSLDIFSAYNFEINLIDNNFNSSQISDVDIIISHDLDILRSLASLDRGELVYLTEENNKQILKGFNILSIQETGICIPDNFFEKVESKRKDVFIGGDQLTKGDLKKIITGLEKANTSLVAEDIKIVNSPEEYCLVTEMEYSYINFNESNYADFLADCFYLIWISRNNYSCLPLWAAANGVIVINIGNNSSINFPVEIESIDLTELALEMIKINKMGKYREKLLSASVKLANDFTAEKIAQRWFEYMEEIMSVDVDIEKLLDINVLEKSKDKYLVDIIISGFADIQELKKYINKIKDYTECKYRITLINDNDICNDLLEELGELVAVINNKYNDVLSGYNRAIIHGNGKYIVYINKNMGITDKWLKPLVERAAEEDIAVVFPEVVDENGVILNKSLAVDNAFPGSSTDDIEIDITIKDKLIDTYTGCFLIKRDLLPIIGIFDDKFNSAYKFMDYFMRAREKGYRLVRSVGSATITKNKINDNNKYSENKIYKQKWLSIRKGNSKRKESNKIVVAADIPWDFKKGRIHHILRNLVKLGFEVLYMSPMCGSGKCREVEDNIFVYSPPGHGSVLYNARNNNNILIGIEISRVIKDRGFNNSILFLTSPYWVFVLKYLEYSILLYDCIENCNVLNSFNSYKEWLDDNEKDLFELSDFVITNQKDIYNEIKSLNKNAYIISDGINTDSWYHNSIDLVKMMHFAHYGLYSQEEKEELLKMTNLNYFSSDINGNISLDRFNENIDVELNNKKSFIERIINFLQNR